HRQLPLDDLVDEQVVARVAAVGDGLDGVVRGETPAARVHVGPAGQEHAVDSLQVRVNVNVLAERRPDDRDAPRDGHGVEVSGEQPQLRAGGLGGRRKVRVDPDVGPRRWGHLLPPWKTTRPAPTGSTCDAAAYTEAAPGETSPTRWNVLTFPPRPLARKRP